MKSLLGIRPAPQTNSPSSSRTKGLGFAVPPRFAAFGVRRTRERYRALPRCSTPHGVSAADSRATFGILAEGARSRWPSFSDSGRCLLFAALVGIDCRHSSTRPQARQSAEDGRSNFLERSMGHSLSMQHSWTVGTHTQRRMLSLTCLRRMCYSPAWSRSQGAKCSELQDAKAQTDDARTNCGRHLLLLERRLRPGQRRC